MTNIFQLISLTVSLGTNTTEIPLNVMPPPLPMRQEMPFQTREQLNSQPTERKILTQVLKTNTVIYKVDKDRFTNTTIKIVKTKTVHLKRSEPVWETNEVKETFIK